jgi:hypothetical protein
MADTYTAYFDASGNPHDCEVLFVSGFISSAKKWLRFERQWIELLDRYHIAPPFHMTEFSNGSGQYKPWRNDNVKRFQFYTGALGVIKRNTNLCISHGVVVQDLLSICDEFEIPEFIEGEWKPYAFCGLKVCIDTVSWMVKNKHKEDTLSLVFEHGDHDQHYLFDRIKDLWGYKIEFAKKNDCTPFQAADFVAWEHRRALQDYIDHKPNPRKSFLALKMQIPGRYGYYSWNWLSDYCIKQEWPKSRKTI